MRNSEHPAYHTVARKFRRLHGLLANFEQPLRDDGFDYDEALQWTSTHMCALSELEEPSGNQPPDPDRLRAAGQDLEPELFKRMEAILNFLHARVPEHPGLPGYRLYLLLWRGCYGEPLRPLTATDLQPLEEPDVPVIAPTIYDVPYERLDATRLALGEMKLPHKGFAAFLLFLCGLFYAVGHAERRQEQPIHDFADGLLDAARESLESAIDFANEPGTAEYLRTHPTPVLPESQSKLFMAVYRASFSHDAAVYEWLNRHHFQRDLTSLLFAMGVRALTDPYARTLVHQWIEDSGALLPLLRDDQQALLREFFNLEV